MPNYFLSKRIDRRIRWFTKPLSFTTLFASALVFSLVWTTPRSLAQTPAAPASAGSSAAGTTGVVSNIPFSAPVPPPGTTINLPPGVQLPPGMQLPPGVSVNSAGAPNSSNAGNPNQAGPAAGAKPGEGGAKNEAAPSVAQLAPDAGNPNAFQVFLAQITGKSVPIFGRDLFDRTNPFAALESVPVPGTYILGPGDEITVKIFSPALDIDQRFIINRDGTISLPKIGPVPLAGTRASEAEGVIKNYLSRMLTGFNVYVTVGQLRGIEIYVVGQTRRPGKFIVSSTSSLINALFATGGPTANGSMRNIQLVRGGRVVGSVDLYQFLQSGDTTKDLPLQAGDVIRVPPVGPQVALVGAIPNQAIYELAPNEKINSLESILQYAGNVPIFTSPLQVAIERIDPKREKPLSALAISLNKEGLATQLKDGDIVTFLPIKPAFDNAISLRILGSPSVRVPIQPGSFLKDVIPNKEALLTNLYFLRRFTPPNSGTGTNDDLSRIRESARLDQINWDQALLERINLGDLSPQIISFNLGAAIAGKDNIELKPGDIITVFSQKDLQVSEEKQIRVVRVQGEVRAPGIYQLKPGETLPDVIAKAGGTTNGAYLYGTVLSRQSVRENQRKNLDQVIRNLQSQLVASSGADIASTTNLQDAQRLQNLANLNRANLEQKINQLRTMNPSGRVSLELNPRDPELPDVLLEDGDEITIPREPSSVGVYGAVYNDNALLFKPGKTVTDYLNSAGVSITAERDWTFLIRADGSIKAPDTSGWFGDSTVMSIVLMPGDNIVVPEKIIRETAYTSFMRGLKDWTQVLFQLGLAAAAVKVLQ